MEEEDKGQLLIQKLMDGVNEISSITDDYRCCVKGQLCNLARRLKLLRPMLEEIRDSKEPLTRDALKPLSVFADALDSAIRFAKEATNIYLVLEREHIMKRFNDVTANLEQALDGINYDKLDISDQVREQVELVIAQFRRSKSRIGACRISSTYTSTNPLFPLPICLWSLLLLLLLGVSPATSSFLNITQILSGYPDLSRFSSLLSSTAVSSDLSSRTSLTLLAVPNSHLRPTSAGDAALSDAVRYHILLRYLTWADLRQIPASGTLVPTLFQTTGRAPANLGSLNLTFDPSDGVVTLQAPAASSSSSSSSGPGPGLNSSATVLSLVKSIPYNLSIFAVSSLVSPYGSSLVASELRPPSPGLNITRALLDGHEFNVAASMLSASGVIDEFEADEAGAGITLFVPTDTAFANLPPAVELQALPAERKALVLKFHVLHSYYPLGSLDSIVNPVQPTLATEDNVAGTFTLNISKLNASVALNSGVVQAVVTQTVFDQNPVAIFGISHVLLPKEFFGDLKGRAVNLQMKNATADPPELLQPPADSPPLRNELTPPPSAAFNHHPLQFFTLLSSSIILIIIYN